MNTFSQQEHDRAPDAQANRADAPARLGEVVVQFDSWYASKKILKFVHRQEWEFTCGLRATRKLNGESLTEHNRRQKHKWREIIRVATAEKIQKYFVRRLEGRLSEIAFDLCVLISKNIRVERTLRILPVRV